MTTEWRKEEQPWGTETYSQHGEDLMLMNIFKLIGIEKPSYLDLGAHSPMTISNTHLLYLHGSRGVNVEANPHLMWAFDLFRAGDKNVNCGVAPVSGVLPFYMWDRRSGINTFSSDEVKWLKEGGKRELTEILQVPVKTVNQIVDEYCGGQFPHLLLTDIEGLDHAVLESCDFTHSWPIVICTEIRPWEAERTKKLLEGRGYFVFCRMQANLIFVLNEFKAALY